MIAKTDLLTQQRNAIIVYNIISNVSYVTNNLQIISY